MPGGACCAAGICCPPGSPEEEAALARVIDAKVGAVYDDMEKNAAFLAKAILSEFELAPKGQAVALRAAWAKSDAELGAALRPIWGPLFTEAAAAATSAALLADDSIADHDGDEPPE
jgi:hypothetical protein